MATARRSSRTAACSSTPLRAIAPGEELGYDYEIGRDKDDPPNVDEIYACRCGSPKCRGSMLEAAPKKKAAKLKPSRKPRRRKPQEGSPEHAQ